RDRRRFRHEEHVDPVVRGLVAVFREGGAGAIGVDAVATRRAVGFGLQRRVDDSRGEGRAVDRVVTLRRQVAGDVGRVRLNLDRGGEFLLLPARGGLAAEVRLRELGAGRVPEGADVGAGVGRRFVETDAGDGAGDVAAELDPKLDRAAVAGGDRGRRRLLDEGVV